MVIKSSKISVETMKELVQTGHDDGTTKNVETFKKGTIIFREGEPGKCMYDIFTGSVNVYKDYGTPSEKLLTTVGANKFLGEMGLINDTPRTATAVVNMDNTMIMSMYLDDLEELYTTNPVKVEMLIKHMSFRIRKLTSDYVDACMLIYEVSEAEKNGSVSDELKNRVKTYVLKY